MSSLVCLILYGCWKEKFYFRHSWGLKGWVKFTVIKRINIILQLFEIFHLWVLNLNSPQSVSILDLRNVFVVQTNDIQWFLFISQFSLPFDLEIYQYCKENFSNGHKPVLSLSLFFFQLVLQVSHLLIRFFL